MPKLELTKKFILERRAEIVYGLHKEGWSDIEIGEMFNLDRTWIHRIRKFYQKEIKKNRK